VLKLLLLKLLSVKSPQARMPVLRQVPNNRSKLKGQRAIAISPFQLSTSGFQLLCNATNHFFHALTRPQRPGFQNQN
jgi:hypothetical protein